MHLGEVKYAVVDQWYALSELNEDLFTSITSWIELDSVLYLPSGEDEVYNLGVVENNAVVLFRYFVDPPSTEYELIQFRAGADIPAITAFALQLSASWRKARLMQDLSKNLSEMKAMQAKLKVVHIKKGVE